MVVNLIQVLSQLYAFLSLLFQAAQAQPHMEYKQGECCFKGLLQAKYCITATEAQSM